MSGHVELSAARSPRPGRAGSARPLGALLCFLVAAIPAPAVAETPAAVTHRVKQGDTLELLAAEYYGDRRYAVFIAMENRLDPAQQPVAEPLPTGARLRVPVSWQITTDVGDTLADLARTHLGDERRARFLIGFNEDRSLDLPASGRLAAGQVLAVPIHVRHEVQPDQTLPELASIYFGTARKAGLIREYNFLDDDELEPGTELLVPIPRVTVQPGRLPEPDPAAQSRAEQHRQTQDRARSAVAAARASWRAGEYAGVRDALIELDMDYLATAEVIEVGVLLGSAWVAFDEPDKARAVFRKILARAPDHMLDPYHASPRIRAVWEQARAAAESAE